MNKNKIKIVIVFLVAIVSALVVFFFIKNRQKSENVSVLAPQIQVKSQYKGKFDVSFSIKENETSLPKNVQVLNISNSPLELTRLSEIASKLGFPGEPSKTKDVAKGEVYFWQNDTGSFFTYPNARRLEYSSYSLYTNAVNKQLSDADVTKTAEDFLINNGFYDQGSLETASLSYLNETSPYGGLSKTTKENALLYQVNFYPKTAGYEIVNKNPEDYTISVKVLRDGTVWSAYASVFEFYSTDTVSFPAKGYQETLNSINKSVLVSLTGAYLSAYDLPENSIKKVTINEITLAYLLESSNSTSLLPVYLLEGSAEVNEVKDPLNVTLYLSAVSEK